MFPNEILVHIGIHLDLSSVNSWMRCAWKYYRLFQSEYFWRCYLKERCLSPPRGIRSSTDYLRCWSMIAMCGSERLPITAPRYVTGSMVVDYIGRVYHVENKGLHTTIIPLPILLSSVLWSGGILAQHILYRYHREVALFTSIFLNGQIHNAHILTIATEIDYVSCTPLPTWELPRSIFDLPSLFILLRRGKKLSFIKSTIDDLRAHSFQEEPLKYTIEENWKRYFRKTEEIEEVVLQRVLLHHLAQVDDYLYLRTRRGCLYRGPLRNGEVKFRYLRESIYLAQEKNVVCVSATANTAEEYFQVYHLQDRYFVADNMFFIRRGSRVYALADVLYPSSQSLYLARRDDM